ncbi:MAG TPA: anti-sigma factor, partial [Naasia sp.]
MTDPRDPYDDAAASGAYALGALTGEDKASFERALQSSEGLRDEVDGFRSAAAELGSAVPAVEPPGAMKADLMARIANLPQQESDEASAPAVVSLAEHRERRAGAAGSRRSARSRIRTFPALVAAAAAVVLFLGGALLGGVLDAVSDSRTTDRFAALNAAADVERSGITLPNGGRAEVVASEELGYSAVVMHGAPALPADQAFQLWYVEE